MSRISEKIKKQLLTMAEDFTRQLPTRLSAIEEGINRVLTKTEDPSDLSELEELHRNIHKLSGSGATFGFESLSALSKQIEVILMKVLERGGKIEGREEEQIVQLFNKIKEDSSCDQKEETIQELSAEVEGEVPQLRRTASSKILLYLTDRRYTLKEEVKQQIGFFGYEVETIFDFETLNKQIDLEIKQLLIINSHFLHLSNTSIKELSAIKKQYEETLRIIFVSEDDDFGHRLETVRAGGDAFFQFPLDIGRFIERVENLIKVEETEPYHILIVDDDPEQVSFHALLLQQAGMITSVARDPSQVVKILVEAKPEMILMDMYMPGCSGMELAAVIRQQEAFVGIPIVFLSIETDMDKQLAAIRLGGDDFLTKPIRPEHLIASITNRAERTRSMRYLMERDSLTGLLNHTNLKEQLSREVMRCRRSGSQISFAMIDVDHFKRVNDRYGHLTGDRVLKSLARLLQERLRSTDIIGRYGGEEFAVVLINTNVLNAKKIMDEIRSKFSKLIQRVNNEEFLVTFSCGIAGFPEFETATEVNEAADKTLYTAKEKGRNMVLLA